MSDSDPLSDEAIEALVRRSLERSAEQVDPRPLFGRIVASWQHESGAAPTKVAELPKRRPWRARTLVWGISAAAVVLLVVLLGSLPTRPALARAEVLVREAKKAHLLPLDRCYLVEVRRDSAVYDETSPMTSRVRLTRLWTRGDRFWVESVQPQQRWAWGRDERNRFWIAFGPHRGLRLEDDEVPRWLNLCCDLYCIRLEQLLGEVLRNFDLEREMASADTSSATQIVRATLKPGRRHPTLRSVVLEIDAETRVVRRMVIERVAKGQPFATATYTLVDDQAFEDGKYQLEGHLSAPSKVFTQEVEPEKRRALLARWFGPRASEYFRLRGED